MRRRSESIEWVDRGGGDGAESERDDGVHEHSVGDVGGRTTGEMN